MDYGEVMYVMLPRIGPNVRRLVYGGVKYGPTRLFN